MGQNGVIFWVKIHILSSFGEKMGDENVQNESKNDTMKKNLHVLDSKMVQNRPFLVKIGYLVAVSVKIGLFFTFWGN